MVSSGSCPSFPFLDQSQRFREAQGRLPPNTVTSTWKYQESSLGQRVGFRKCDRLSQELILPLYYFIFNIYILGWILVVLVAVLSVGFGLWLDVFTPDDRTGGAHLQICLPVLFKQILYG